MADELNTPNHRYYQNRYNVELAPNEMSKQWILASGIARIDNAAVLPLFASAEPGTWYDPSDLTTLFTDTAGTTPVTAPGQTVGLMLDKSQGLVLGSELLANGAIGLVGVSTAATYSTTTGVGSVSRVDASNQSYVQWSSLTSSSTYKLQVTCTSGAISVRAGVVSASVFQTLTAGQTFDVYASPVGGFLTITNAPVLGTATFTVTSLKLLAGNHATQATLAQRPTYGINPIVGTRNLLTYTEQFDNAAWDKGTGGSVSANSVVAPDGTTTADAYTWGTSTASYAFLSQTVSGQNSTQNFTYSVWMKRPTGSGNKILRLNISDVATSTGISGQTTVTEQWQRFSFTRASATNTGSVGVGVSIGASGTIVAGDVLHVWGAQLELGPTATAYQKVVSQYEVTQAGVQSAGYLAFDGVDDGMVTNTITPGIDKVQVFAGVRKLSDAATATLASFGGASANSWELFAPRATNNYYGMAYRTTTALEAGNFTAVAPDTAVLTGTGDISAPAVTLRRNGVVSDTNTTALAFANFAAYPLYLGRRGGSSLPFNGRLYSLIVRFGANLTDGQIASTESWVNSKTGAF